jgi:hypothetical protein
MKTVIELALEAGFEEIATHKDGDSDWLCFTDELERFAELVRADERNACAQVCDGVQDCGPENGCCPTYWNEALERAIAAIRARSNT